MNVERRDQLLAIVDGQGDPEEQREQARLLEAEEAGSFVSFPLDRDSPGDWERIWAAYELPLRDAA